MLGLALALATPTWGIPVAAQAETSASYVVDMETIRTRFHKSGSFDVTLPQIGVVTVAGSESRFRENDYWTELTADGGTILHEDLTVAMHGRVVGHNGTYVDLLLGDYGLYGTLRLGNTSYVFNPLEGAPKGEFTQTVVAEAASSKAEDLDSVPLLEGFEADPIQQGLYLAGHCTTPPVKQGCPWPCGKPTQSFAQLDVEVTLQIDHSDWKDRTISAFKGHHGSWEMWKDTCLELLMKGNTPRGLPVNVLQSASSRVSDYHAWLEAASGRLTGANSYQLWTWRDLDDGRFGAAWSNEAQPVPAAVSAHEQAEAASIVEGNDFSGDGYNADDFQQRARVSGHELSHIYGEENHPTHCKSSSKCNIMKQTAVWDTAEYWIDSSRCEVYRYYFHVEDEYDGPPEPCPNWYQP